MTKNSSAKKTCAAPSAGFKASIFKVCGTKIGLKTAWLSDTVSDF